MSLISIWYHLLSPFHIKIGRKNDSDFVHLFLKLRPNFRDFTPLKFNFQFLTFDFLILIFYCPNFLNSAENSKPKFTLRMQRQFRMINCGKKQPCGQCKKYKKDFAMIAVINSEFQEIFFTVQLNRAKKSPTTSGYPVISPNWTFCGPGHQSRSL